MWVIYSILTALFLSLRDVAIKQSAPTASRLSLAWSLYLFSLPFLLPAAIVSGVPQIGGEFWYLLLIAGLCDMAAGVLYVRALELGDLSRAAPMLCFVPVFQLLTSPLIVGEYPSALGVVGVAVIFIGTLIVHRSASAAGSVKLGISLDASSLCMLGVAFLWSISSNFHKLGVQASSSYFWVLSVAVFISVVMFPFVLREMGGRNPLSRDNVGRLLFPGMCNAATLWFYYAGIELAHVAYVSSIRRTSIIVSIMLGVLLFKETGFKHRIAGGAVMILGVLVITLG